MGPGSGDEPVGLAAAEDELLGAGSAASAAGAAGTASLCFVDAASSPVVPFGSASLRLRSGVPRGAPRVSLCVADAAAGVPPVAASLDARRAAHGFHVASSARFVRGAGSTLSRASCSNVRPAPCRTGALLRSACIAARGRKRATSSAGVNPGRTLRAWRTLVSAYTYDPSARTLAGTLDSCAALTTPDGDALDDGPDGMATVHILHKPTTSRSDFGLPTITAWW